MLKHLFAKKTLHALHSEMTGENRLRRALGPLALTNMGIGCIIGSGIFVLTGLAAHDKTGPALILSFVVSGFACILAALCYAEFAAMAPVAGSAYTYAYATLGELFAWIIGWDLVLEYTVASATVANAWSGYLKSFLAVFHVQLPRIIATTPFGYDQQSGHLTGTGALLDLPALLIVLAVTVVMVIGIRESAHFNSAMVGVKLAVVVFVIAVGAFFIHPANWHPFAPYGLAGFSLFGKVIWGHAGASHEPVGMLAGAAYIFFAYIGFDAISTQAEEAKNPQRDLPIGIIASLTISTILYIAVSAVLTGMVPYHHISVAAPVSNAFMQAGLPWAQFIIAVGVLAGLTSVLLVLMLSQPRVLLAMSRDGMLPPNFFAAIHHRFRTPWKSSLLTGMVVALMASLIPLQILAELVNIGTLLAFIIVCLAVLVMRKTNPQAERPFRCPWVPAVPLLGAAMCLLLMCSLPSENWLRLFAWLLIGFAIYFGYSRHHSVLARGRQSAPEHEEIV